MNIFAGHYFIYHFEFNSRYEKDTSSADDLFNGLGLDVWI